MNQEIRIRDVKAEDLESVLEIVRSSPLSQLHFGEVIQEINGTQNGKARRFLAEEDGKVVGYASLRKGNDVAYLERMLIGSKNKKEVRKRLLSHVIKTIKEEHPNTRALNTLVDPSAIHETMFYLQEGFQPRGIVNDESILGIIYIQLSLDLGEYRQKEYSI